MAKKQSKGGKSHQFTNKLLLNQWLISLFGIDPLQEHTGKTRPFHILADPIRDPRMEGLDADNLHKFYHNFTASNIFWNQYCRVSKPQILVYEENIVRHTRTINERRQRKIVWKYYQWLTLLFTEIYLDRFFSDREALARELNDYVEKFNRRWADYGDIPYYDEDDLNKLCLQNATGSGKTLIMHVNLLQYRHYAWKYGKARDLSRVILLTPNERLSDQHIVEFRESNIPASHYLESRESVFATAKGLDRVDVLEITKLADQQGPNTIAARSLGDQNLLFVDEGHRGMSGKEEGVWFSRRSDLCAKGFTFEYSATFEQAVQAAKRSDFENTYAKTIIFDYSYRWFYEDGFGKDYQILNLPAAYDEIRSLYLTACLLKFYQQLRIYDERAAEFDPFNLEKPLWVFVGSTVSSGKLTKDEKIVAADVALIIHFVADFLSNPRAYCTRIGQILRDKGQDTGLVDNGGNDIFAGSFIYLAKLLNQGDTIEGLYRDILDRFFHNAAGGFLSLNRIKGESGEIALRVGTSEIPFGLINVGDAKGLCDHVADVATQNGTRLTVEDSDFTEAMFASVKDSGSPVNLLIGSKKFVEGWDCWRVSTMGLMHVGKSEGTQIIQLFGRGVRLKGYDWCLKRSGHANIPVKPDFIEEIETLNVFGIEADFMERFREFLKEEGLPGNERRTVFKVPLNVTYDFGKRLKILRPKKKTSDGREYDFKKDAPVPRVGDVPEYLTHNPVVADWYPRIQSIQSRGTQMVTQKDTVSLSESHLAFIDFDLLFFELEQYKRERSWHNLNISKAGIRELFSRHDWYILYLPKTRLNPTGFDGILLLQQVAIELLKRYLAHYYNFRKREYIEPRLEYRDLTREDDNLPPKDDFYKLICDGADAQVIAAIKQIQKDLEEKKDELLKAGDLHACNFNGHLFQPLFHVRRGGKITILPVVLNESEYQFVTDLKAWCDTNKDLLKSDGTELFLLRNLSRGKGVGFFEAGNFHPDFILWTIKDDIQYVSFVEPHGLVHEGPGSDKTKFYERIKDVEKRLNDPSVILNGFILSMTPFSNLEWDISKENLEKMHVLFMKDEPDQYISKLMAMISNDNCFSESWFC